MLNRRTLFVRWALRNKEWPLLAITAAALLCNGFFAGYYLSKGRIGYAAWYALLMTGTGVIDSITLRNSYRRWEKKELTAARKHFMHNIDRMWLEGFPQCWRVVLDPTKGDSGNWVIMRPFPKRLTLPSGLLKHMDMLKAALDGSIQEFR